MAVFFGYTEPNLDGRSILMMNNEDLEQKMTFIVNQQAKFSVDIEKLYEAQRLTEQKLSEANEMVTRLAYVTNVGFKDVNAKINALVDSQIRTDDIVKGLAESQKKTEATLNARFSELAEFQKKTERGINELTDSQKKTDEEFRKLITRLDRRSRNGGNTS